VEIERSFISKTLRHAASPVRENRPGNLRWTSGGFGYADCDMQQSILLNALPLTGLSSIGQKAVN